MSNRKNIFQFLFSVYQTEAAARTYKQYRITKKPDEADPHVYFQIAGKNLTLHALPEEIMHSDILLGFSKADIAIITHLGTKTELEKKYAEKKQTLLARIVQQIFGKSGKTKFMVKLPEQDKLVEAVPEEVMTNKEALGMFESHEAAMIGYAAAENRMLEIRRQTGAAPTCKILQHDLLSNQITYLDEEREAKHTSSLKDIFYNKKLLSLFTKLDQQIISFAAGQEYQKSITSPHHYEYSIVNQSTNSFIFKNKAGEEREISFVEVAFNENLLMQFSPREQHIIRFVAGELHSKQLDPQQPTLKINKQTGDMIEYVDLEGNVTEARILDIAFNRNILEQFSLSDRELIAFAAGESHGKRTLHKPISLKMLAHSEGIIDYQDLEGNIFKASCLDVAVNKELLSQFSDDDRDVIRFTAGEMHQNRINPKKAIQLKLITYVGNSIAEYENESGERIKKPFIELAFEANLLDCFSQTDRDLIRFVAGELSKEKENLIRGKF